ncbi:MAG: hypothetical protein A2W03_11020 [Candidatus Aminicenantes bacterium RBG_16_63_16]|nr:MAG: hypothetical protein A2W03_11020 [Candidatus Aminicenantes bacterium RBG_16_63_16]
MTQSFIRKVLMTVVVMLASLAVLNAAQQSPWQAWKHRLPIVLTERDAATAGLLPVDVTFSMLAADIGDPAKEIRLVLKTPAGEKEVPFQLSRLSSWKRDTDGVKSLPTVSGMITFFDTAPGSGPAEYALLYGNPAATAPDYPTDLRVSGDSPAWTIENSKMTVRLHGRNPANGDVAKALRPITAGGWTVQPAHNTNFNSGQLARVDLKSRPAWPLAPYSGVMHWEPGIFIPTRGWLHVFEWDPPPVCEIEKGPLFVEIRRSGPFPKVPEVKASVVYRIFTNRPYVESGTRIDVLETVGVVSIRNNDMVFDNGTFTHMAWPSAGTPVIKDLNDYPRVDVNGDVLRISDEIPFFALLNPAEKIGVGTVKDMYANVGPDGTLPVVFDNSFYLSNLGREGLMFFFRPLVYFNIGFDRKQLITVPGGSVYAERNLFPFFESNDPQPIQYVLALAAAVRAKAKVSIGAILWPPSR